MALTALGPKVTGVIYTLGGGYLPAILVIAAITSLLLGTLSPSVGAYVVVALTITPLLMQLGLTMEQGHFFALYYAVMGFLTPPNAPAILVSSPIARSPFLASTLQAMRLAFPGYLLPILFCYQPALLGQFSSGVLSGVLAIVVAILAIFSAAVLLCGYYFSKLSWLETALAGLSTAGFVAYFFADGKMLSIIAGGACIILLTLWQLGKRRSGASPARP